MCVYMRVQRATWKEWYVLVEATLRFEAHRTVETLALAAAAYMNQ